MCVFLYNFLVKQNICVLNSFLGKNRETEEFGWPRAAGQSLDITQPPERGTADARLAMLIYTSKNICHVVMQ